MDLPQTHCDNCEDLIRPYIGSFVTSCGHILCHFCGSNIGRDECPVRMDPNPEEEEQKIVTVANLGAALKYRSEEGIQETIRGLKNLDGVRCQVHRRKKSAQLIAYCNEMGRMVCRECGRVDGTYRGPQKDRRKRGTGTSKSRRN